MDSSSSALLPGDQPPVAEVMRYNCIHSGSSPSEIDSIFTEVLPLSVLIFDPTSTVTPVSESGPTISTAAAGPEEAQAPPGRSGQQELRSNESVWRQRFSREGVCYTATGRSSANPIGFVFSHVKSHPPSSLLPPTTIHIWIAGVSPNHRKHGVLSELMKMFEVDVKAGRWSQMRVASVRSMPERFGDMIRWLESHGWGSIGQMEGGRITYQKVME